MPSVFKVYPAYHMPTYVENDPHICISITSPNDPVAIFNTNPKRLDVLYLDFYDLDKPTGRFQKVFTDAQAKEILEYVNKYASLCDTVIVNCQAGVSRSAGVAAALSKIWTGEDDFFFNSRLYRPNMMIYQKILRKHYYG